MTHLDKIIKSPLSNIDLNEFIKDINNEFGEKKSVNIFTTKQMMSDPIKFKKNLNKNSYCIIFLEPKRGDVGHWVVFYKNKSGSGTCTYFFDSYGNSPKTLDKNLFNFLAKYYPKTKYNTYQYQKYSSEVATCGRYSIFIVGLNRLIEDLTLETVFDVFSYFKKKMKKNYDYIVSYFVNFDI